MVRTGLVTAEACLEHDSGPGHPERPERLAAIVEHLRAAGILSLVKRLAPRGPADEALLSRVHTPGHVLRIRQLSDRGCLVPLGPDTVVSGPTYTAAATATAGVILAVDEIMAGRLDRAFCALRPPGHHAERERAMGFCYFNHVAVAARHLQDRYGLGRVAIIDWDVHHGNGTQKAFEEDPTVLYFSIHQYPYYPGTGSGQERGLGPGTGTTLNVAAPAGWGDGEYARAFGEVLRPAVDAFQPEFILVSSGFDAHALDPLGGMQLTEAGFGELTRQVTRMAADHCAGRLVSVLEGGYHLDATGRSATAHLAAMLEADAPAAPAMTAQAGSGGRVKA
ncbi:MAG: histone deacetylase [Gemmatimonadota bacterium]